MKIIVTGRYEVGHSTVNLGKVAMIHHHKNVGAVVGTALALYAAAIINPAFDAAGRIRAQSDITDALVRSQQEPQAEPYVNPGQDVTRRP